MIRFSLFGFPIGIDWFFWLSSALLGGGLSAQTPEDWTRVAIWIGVVFVSILIHELGHAFMGRRYGATPAIQLHGLGGVTILPGANFTRPQNIAVSAAGPAASLALGAFVVLSLPFLPDGSPYVRVAVTYALWVNFFWTIINLLPIQPLDGGQILRDLLGPRYLTVTIWIGVVCAVGVGIFAFQKEMYFLAVMLGFLAWQNFSQQTGGGGIVTR